MSEGRQPVKLFLSLLFIALVAFPCAPARATDSDEKFIQALWQLQGNDGHGHSWMLEWTFMDGKFTLHGYPPLSQEGRYRIIKTEGNKLTLELYDQKGNFGTENSQVKIIIDKRNDKLKIKDQGPFSRIKVIP
jgi:hypothetical protein